MKTKTAKTPASPAPDKYAVTIRTKSVTFTSSNKLPEQALHTLKSIYHGLAGSGVPVEVRDLR